MTFNFNYLLEKYKNLISEEEFVNDYSYQKPVNLKYNGITRFKRPKLFYINRNVEDFLSFKSGSQKTLQEFQHLFIQKFLIKNIDINKNRNKIKQSLELFTKKEKLKTRNKIIKDKENNKENITNNKKKEKNIKNKERENTYTSLLKIIKSNNKEDNPKRSHSRTISQIIKVYNMPPSSSKSAKKATFNLTAKNKYFSYQLMKQGEKFLTKSVQIPQRKNNNLFREKSRLSLLKHISSQILQDKITKRFNFSKNLKPRSKSNYKIRNVPNIKEHFSSDDTTKHNFNSFIKSKYVNKSAKNKYYEISKKGCNFSDVLVVKKSKLRNSTKKEKKKERKIMYKYSTNSKRPLSALERYFIKYGAGN